MTFAQAAVDYNPQGTPPSAPQFATATGVDSGANVSWYPPSSSGTASITSYTITPYLAGVAQTPTTVAVGSLTTIPLTHTYSSVTRQSFNSTLNATSALQAPVSGLTNGSSYTFTVKANSSAGASVESSQSGSALPLTGLLFGDEFNGPANGPIDPEWWIYDRCGFLSQSEVEWYKASHVYLDGSSNIILKAEKVSQTGSTYPSNSNATVTQPWTSGAFQSNTRSYIPSAGKTLTIEAVAQVCSSASTGAGMWPSVWCEGTAFQDQWKVDPAQPGWDNSTQAEIDIMEFVGGNPTTQFGMNTWGNTNNLFTFNPGLDCSLAPHTYRVDYQPSNFTKFYFDGTLEHTVTTSGVVPTNSFFLMWYLQMNANASSSFSPSLCIMDYYRVSEA